MCQGNSLLCDTVTDFCILKKLVKFYKKKILFKDRFYFQAYYISAVPVKRFPAFVTHYHPKEGHVCLCQQVVLPNLLQQFNKLLFLVRWHASKDSATHHELKRNICSVAIRQSKGQRFIALLWIMSSTSGRKIHHLQKYICALEIFW